MDRTELAWAAGFWDGEGSAYLSGANDRATKQPHARINQSSTDGVPEVLARFQGIVCLGKVQGPDMKEGREPLYRWELSSRADIDQLLRLIGPWLCGVKRDQFESVLGVRAPASLDWTQMELPERCAWAAGLWDGEGSLCLLKHRSHDGHFVPEAAVTQSSTAGTPEVLTRISSIGPMGFLYGPYSQPDPWAPVYRWKLFRLDEIRTLVEALRPWLGQMKITQADNVFKVLDAQPALARGNPAWGSHKTHCLRGHEYASARIRPFRSRGRHTKPPRVSHQCLQCVREDARAKRHARRKTKNGG